MRFSSSTSRSRSSRYVEVSSPQEIGPASLVTLVLLAGILLVAPLILGAARLWIQLPLLGCVGTLLFIQGLRLTRKAPPGEVRRIDVIDLSVVLFTLYALVRWLTSPTEYFSRIEALDVIAYATVFLTCRYGLAQRKLGLVILFLLIGLGIFETCFGYYLHSHPEFFPFGPTEQLQLHYAPRWVGTYGCPNHYVSLLVMAVGAALALACFSKLPWPLRIVLFYLAGMTLVGVMYSVSRGGWFAMVASIVALMIFGVRNGSVRWWIPVTGALVVLIAGACVFSLSPDVRDRFMDAKSTVQNGNLSSYVRYELARDALRIASDHPLVGTGPATFVFIHPQYQSSTFDRKAVLTHDDYLNCLDDYGVIGFSLALLFVIAVTLRYFQTPRGDSRWQERVVIAAGFAAWAALLIHSTLDFNLHIPANALWFFALTGLGLGRLRQDAVGTHWSIIPLAPLGGYLGWVLAIVSLGYISLVGKSALGDIGYEQAYDLALTIPTSDSIKQTQDALAYDRGNAQAWTFLGDLYRYRASREPDIEGQVAEGQKALDAYNQAQKANTLDDTIRAKMGMTYDLMRRYPEAYFCYQAAVKAQPYNGQFWSWLGNHYWQRGMIDKATEAFEKAKNCPHGKEGSDDALKELKSLPALQEVPQSPVQAILQPADTSPDVEQATPVPLPPEPPPAPEEIQKAQSHPPTIP